MASRHRPCGYRHADGRGAPAQCRGHLAHDIGREAFVEKVWEWKGESGGTITRQLRRMGASLDWAHERFTMDEGLSAAVQEVFVKLYEDDLIYRGKRLVNWDPVLHTAVSDLEVISKRKTGTFGTYATRWWMAAATRGGHDTPGDHAGRHGGGRTSRRRALPRSGGQRGPPAAHGPHHPDHRRRATWTRISAAAA